MNKILKRQRWTCANCLEVGRYQLRHNSNAAAIAQDHNFENAFIGQSHRLQTDNQFLRDVFNNKSFWQDFSTRAKTTSGLIGNKHLTTPRGFHKFAETSLRKCKMLVDRTLAASTVEEYRAIPKDLDRLSDLLCRVIDLSDFIRGIHPDQSIAAAATASYSMMFQYMNELNTTTGLNQQLKKAWHMPEVYSQWSEEEKMVAMLLFKDFAKSGIDMPASQREQFVDLSNEIANVGTEFVNRMEHAAPYAPVSKAQLAGVDPRLVHRMSSWKKSNIPVFSSTSNIIMSQAHNSDVKKDLYSAERTASKDSIARLEQLLLKRAKLAKVTGYENYAEMTLADKMSKNPEAVRKFLRSLNESNKGQVKTELDRLLDIKKMKNPESTGIGAWEHSYLLNQLAQRKPPRTSKSRLSESANAYFAVGHVIQGLSNLFESLYGVRLVPKETKIGEVWHSDVRRLDVYTESQEHIATMYCDLFSRPGKLPNPAHFTLVCSRELSPEEITESQERNEPLNLGVPTSTSIDQVTGQASHYQIPIIALVCDFPDTSGALEPTLLHPTSVTTLFHEMGHAVHSILGRTSLQGISGTRCATDFAELPSVLMEYFASDAAVLKMFARHWRTNSLIPDELITAMHEETQDRAERRGGWDNANQIRMAMLDQFYHSNGPVTALTTGHYDSTKVYHDVWDTYGFAEEPGSTAWQGFFGHLYGYGATYYSYLFDRAIARQVWRAVFKDGHNSTAIDREAGERFKQEVLRWGGGRDPWICLEGLMGDGKGVLAEGGSDAMDLVGKWGVDAGSEGQM